MPDIHDPGVRPYRNSCVVKDMKRIAPLLGFSGYQPLIRAYIGQGLRKDVEHLDSDAISGLVASLKKRGVSSAVIEEALAEAAHNQDPCKKYFIPHPSVDTSVTEPSVGESRQCSGNVRFWGFCGLASCSSLW